MKSTKSAWLKVMRSSFSEIEQVKLYGLLVMETVYMPNLHSVSVPI